jgi:hypothetical protein
MAGVKASDIILAAEAAAAVASSLYTMAKQIDGTLSIPEWAEIGTMNTETQAQIDQEKV